MILKKNKYVHFVVLCDVIPEFSRTEETIQSAVRYPSELTDEEGEILEPLINELESYTIGRPQKSDLRELLNAIFYLNQTGYPWRDLPKDFPPYKLVNYYYNKWTDNHLPEKVNMVFRQRLRQKKTESQIQREQLLIVKVSREPRNPM